MVLLSHFQGRLLQLLRHPAEPPTLPRRPPRGRAEKLHLIHREQAHPGQLQVLLFHRGHHQVVHHRLLLRLHQCRGNRLGAAPGRRRRHLPPRRVHNLLRGRRGVQGGVPHQPLCQVHGGLVPRGGPVEAERRRGGPGVGQGRSADVGQGGEPAAGGPQAADRGHAARVAEGEAGVGRVGGTAEVVDGGDFADKGGAALLRGGRTGGPPGVGCQVGQGQELGVHGAKIILGHGARVGQLQQIAVLHQGIPKIIHPRE
mmetsp:Transcript_22912/g.50332  ORF Transcript_22912/g.50332 Transcript_22912/m.50332 type:complete len:257 (-) Transcript_22912:450-1220(-)